MNKKSSSLVIRADANTRIGTGHLMRCLALGQAWQEVGGKVTFITCCDSPALLQRLMDEGFSVFNVPEAHPNQEDLKLTLTLVKQCPDAWVILDGYHFDPIYQFSIKEAGLRLLVIDDMAHQNHYFADMLLNQNPYAANLSFSVEPYTQLLLGSQYVLLRKEFRKWQGYERDVPEVAKKVLITLGGGDPENTTLKIVEGLQKITVKDLEVLVVIGASNPHFDLLQSVIADSSLSICLQRNVDNMPDLMAWADLAITAAGSTTWELAYMGLPNLVLILAENQELIAESLADAGVAVNMGWQHLLTDRIITEMLTGLLNGKETRVSMASVGRNMIDGEGVFRVIALLNGEDR